MIRVDKSTGSVELIPLLQQLKVPCEKACLNFADFAFQGEGEGGRPVPIGVERKTLTDFIGSILNGRLPGHQLPGLLGAYEDVWIVLEGEWRISKFTQHVQVKRWVNAVKKPGTKIKKWVDLDTALAHALSYQEMEAMLLTIELRGGVRIRRTKDPMETAHFLKALHYWWTDQGFASHRSHLKFYSQFADKNLLVKPSLCRIMASQLPGIGYEKSGPVAEHFGSVQAMVEAPESEWTKIKGIGPTIAKRVVEKLVVAGATV